MKLWVKKDILNQDSNITLEGKVMPNIPQQQTIVQYIVSSLQLNYTFAFYAPLLSDIQLYYQAANVTPVPTSDILALNVDYTVTYNSDPTTGGFITLLFTPTSGFYLTINRQVQASLNTNFANAQNFNGANLDAALDRLLLLIQQNLNYITQRNLSYVINTYLPSAIPFTQLPPLEQNQVWTGSGQGVIAGTIAQVPSASLLQSMLASNSMGSDGAEIVGYYDAQNSNATTVAAFLQLITPLIYNAQQVLTGTIIDFAGTSPPTGYLVCDGSAVSRTTYANLFSAISTTWGAGNGTTTFNLPNLTRRNTIGSGGTPTSPAFPGNAVGNTGGEEVHTMTTAELVSHAHNSPANTQFFLSETGGLSLPVAGSNAGVGSTTATTGSSTPFNVMQLGAVVLKCIKY